MCVCVCVCVCACRGASGRRVAQPDKHTRKRVIERLNKSRLVMVADMAIPRFLCDVRA